MKYRNIALGIIVVTGVAALVAYSMFALFGFLDCYSGMKRLLFGLNLFVLLGLWHTILCYVAHLLKKINVES